MLLEGEEEFGLACAKAKPEKGHTHPYEVQAVESVIFAALAHELCTRYQQV